MFELNMHLEACTFPEKLTVASLLEMHDNSLTS